MKNPNSELKAYLNDYLIGVDIPIKSFDKYNKQLWKIVNAIISKDEAGESHRVVVVNKDPDNFLVS